MPPILRIKTTIASLNLGYDAVKVAQEGRVPMEQIENLMNSIMRQQRNPSNNLVEQVKGRGVGNVDAFILFFNNSNEFQALMQEIKSQ